MRNKFILVGIVFIVQFASAQELVTLEKAIALAVERNYDVQVSRNTAEVAGTDNRYANGAFLPRLNGTAALLWTDADQEIDINTEGGVVKRTGNVISNNLTTAVQLQWTLFDGTRMFATRERVSRIASQGELIVKNQIVNTIASVINNYYDIVRQKQQLKAIEEQMAFSEERVRLAERKLQVGVGAKPELLQARVDYNAQRAQALQQIATIDQLKEQLNGLVGLQLPNEYEVGDTILIDTGIDANAFLNTIEDTNYELKIGRENIRISALSVRERRAEYLPFLDFNAAYNYSRLENVRQLNPFAAVFVLNNGFNYGFTLNVPILNGFNQRRLVQQARLNYRRQEVLYDQQKANVNIALVNAFTNYDNARKILTIEEENILLAKENAFIAMEVFKRGASTFIEVRTAQQSLADAYTRLINARFLAKVAETELLRLNGSLIKG